MDLYLKLYFEEYNTIFGNSLVFTIVIWKMIVLNSPILLLFSIQKLTNKYIKLRVYFMKSIFFIVIFSSYAVVRQYNKKKLDAIKWWCWGLIIFHMVLYSFAVWQHENHLCITWQKKRIKIKEGYKFNKHLNVITAFAYISLYIWHDFQHRN